MRYVIMADGKMRRWYTQCDTPKHLQLIGTETLLQRIVRQVHEADAQAEVLITSHDSRYDVKGARRYEPENNVLEIDRFTWELIEDNVCFLYGDTFYTDEAIRKICTVQDKELHFVGNRQCIVALKVFRAEVMRREVTHVRELFQTGQIHDCRGWQVYQSFLNLPFDKIEIGEHFTLLGDNTQGFNTIDEYRAFLNKYMAEG